MGKKQACKLILKIEFADAFLIKGNTQKFSTQKLGSIQLLHRFHINAITENRLTLPASILASPYNWRILQLEQL
jgi:hypothetical protein